MKKRKVFQIISMPYPVFTLRLSTGTLQKPDKMHPQISYGKIWGSYKSRYYGIVKLKSIGNRNIRTYFPSDGIGNLISIGFSTVNIYKSNY